MEALNLIGWVVENAGTIAAVWAGIHAAALLIVNLTPTPYDDLLIGRIYRVVEAIAGIVTPRAKLLPGASIGDPY